MATKLRKMKQEKSITSFKEGETRIKIKMDINFLNSVILYVFTKSKAITKANLSGIKKFFCEVIDEDIFLTNDSLYKRIKFIQNLLDLKITKGIKKKEVLLTELSLPEDNENQKIIDMVINSEDLSLDEIHYINKAISERLRFAYLVYYKETLQQLFYRIDQGGYDSYNQATEDIIKVISLYMNDYRKSEMESSLSEFCLKPEVLEMYIKDLVKKATDPKLNFKTGLRCLNELLSPGFAPGRLYLFLGITGGYKSSMLLQCARWIKLYNKPILKRKDPNLAIPTVLLITTENSVEETVARLISMSTDDRPMSEWDPDEAVNAVKTKGKLVLTSASNTDIMIKYYANNAIDTSDLYGIIDDIEDENREVVALIFDYIKRIRPAERATDERIQLKNVSNELKTLAIKYDIPVITANQINRQGNMTIDSAAGEGKEDLARFLGRGNIAVSWDLLENVDWAAIINLEKERKSNLLYLTIKRIKIRYKDMARVSYINHPFESNSTIRLKDDIYLDKAISLESLSSDMEGYRSSGSRGSSTINKKKLQKEVPLSDFDFNKSLFGSD